MKLFRYSTAILLFLFYAAASFPAAETPPKTVSIHQLPVPVQKTVNDELGDSKLVQIEKNEENGEVTYVVTRKIKDEERDFVVAEDGTLLSVEVSLDETDPVVQKAIKAQLRDGTLDSIEKTFEGNDINYEVDMTTKSGEDRSFTITLDGKLTSVQVNLEEIPAPARKAIEAHLGNGKITDVFRLVDGNDISFDAEVDHGGKTRDVIVSPAGKLESIQVALSEIPPEAQKTIQDKIGNGRITRIDQDFTPRQGVYPYEVEGRKDGKPFNFSVGPRGRFLGMDD